jgi:addiction module HigA family antidote
MVKSPKTPGSVLQAFLDEYQINPAILSRAIKLSYPTIQNILKNKCKISVSTALLLGKYFDNSPVFWLDIQITNEMVELATKKQFVKILQSIPKAKKPADKTAKTKPAKAKSTTLSAKRKKAAKTPGVKPTRAKSNNLSAKRKKAAKVPGSKPARGRRPRKK